jgi:hypothetical protein
LKALLAEKPGGIGNHVIASAEKLTAFSLAPPPDFNLKRLAFSLSVRSRPACCRKWTNGAELL